jgi:hypothetical protein
VSKDSRNLKRVFNRLFVVATVAWALYCGVVFPLQKVGDVLRRADDIFRLEESQCAETAIRENTTKDVVACWKASEDAWEQRKQHVVRRVYAASWPFILTATVGLPPIIYGVSRGIAAVWFLMWRDRERQKQ